MAGLVSPDGDALSGDPIRFGAARMASFTASGTATSGSVYIRGGDTDNTSCASMATPARPHIMRFDVGRRHGWRSSLRPRVQSDRRREPRRQTVADHGVVSVRIRPGIEARLLDLSAGGAHLQTTQCLPPGCLVHVQLAFPTLHRHGQGTGDPESGLPSERRSDRIPMRRAIRSASLLGRRVHRLYGMQYSSNAGDVSYETRSGPSRAGVTISLSARIGR